MEKVDDTVDIKLLIRQSAIILLIPGGPGLSYLNFSTKSYISIQRYIPYTTIAFIK